MSDHLDTRADRLAAALDDFLGSSPDVEAAAVVSFDGLPMASALPDDLDEDRVGAMSAALLSLGEQAAVGLGRGPLNQLFVEGDHGFVFLMSCEDQAVLAAIAGRQAKIGFMLFEMRRAAERVADVLAPPTADAEVAAPADRPAAPAPHNADVEDDPVEPAGHTFAAPAALEPAPVSEPRPFGNDPEAVSENAPFGEPYGFGNPDPESAPSPFAESSPFAEPRPFEAPQPFGASEKPAPFSTPAGFDEPAADEPAADEPAAAEAPAVDEPTFAPVADDDTSFAGEDDSFSGEDDSFAALGELRAVATPAPKTPPPAAPQDQAESPAEDEPASDWRYDDAGYDDAESDLLTVLATQPLSVSDDDYDLLTEALFEVRRATGGNTNAGN